MGSGKTSWIIQSMNESYTQNIFTQPNRRYMYITPLLNEVERIEVACPELKFRSPDGRHGKKFWHLERLIEDNENIASTHALFRMLTKDVSEKLKAAKYTLVIDETLSCVEFFTDLTKDDKKLIFDLNIVYVDEGTNLLRWNDEVVGDYSLGHLSRIKNLCDNGNLLVFKDSRGTSLMLWSFPVEFLECFDEVIVLTYLFDGSPMKPYLDSKGIEFDRKTIIGDRETGYEMVDYSLSNEASKKAKLRERITIYEGRSNTIGRRIGKGYPLSKSWYARAAKGEDSEISTLKTVTESFFKMVGTSSNENAAVCFKDYRGKVKGVRYGSFDKNFIAKNARATNQYAHKRSMAYLVNVFHHTMISRWFLDQGIIVDEDVYALSEMVQVIWRTAIRNDEPIDLFIPSDRMRGLLKNWLNCDSAPEFVVKLNNEMPLAC